MMKTQALKSVVFAAVAAGLSFVGIAADYWASPTGSGTGTSKDDPTSLAAALAAANAAGEASTVHLLKGEYPIAEQIVLGAGVSLVGAGRDETLLVGTDGLTVTMVKMSSAESALKSLTITNVYASISGQTGSALNMTAGLVQGCRITHCATANANGGGVWLSGGLMTDSVVDHCVEENRAKFGNGIFLTGSGVVSNCEIYACKTFGSHTSSRHTEAFSGGGGVAMYLSKTGDYPILTHCKVHDNGLKPGGGVWQNCGRIDNCLFWGNGEDGYTASTLYKYAYNAGTPSETVNCTFFGNKDSVLGATSVELYQTGGTTYNCIFWRDITGLPSWATDKVATVTGGEFANNVVKTAVSGYESNNSTGDPLFVDAAIGDFHLSQAGSSAYDCGLPFDFVKDDLDGRPRSDGKPDIGCYEYDSSKDPKEASIQASATDLSDKMTLVLKAVLSGGKIEDYSVEWTIDGRVAGVTPEISVSGLAAGSHAVALKLTPLEGGEPLTAGIEGGVTVWATKTYVNTTGNGTYPYVTPETATNSLVEAMRALWNDGQTQTEVSIGEGLYELDEPVTVGNRVTVIGAGRDKTLFRNPTGRGFVVDNAAASVSALTVTNSAYGISLLNGTVFDCRVTDCDDKSAVTGEAVGGGIYVENGLVYDCLVENIKLGKKGNASGAGIGVRENPSVVSNCMVRNCSVTANRTAFGAGHGVSLYYAKDSSGAHVSLLTHCTIENCGTDATTGRQMQKGGGLSVDWGRVENCVVRGCRSQNCDVIYFSNASARNCLFADNRGVNNAVRLEKATLDNCTIAGNCGAVTSVWANAACKIYNSILSTVAGEYTIEEGATIERSCCPALEEGVNGNTAKDPKFKSVVRGDYRLKGGSPCIDAGDNSRWDGVVDPVDLDGEPRIRYGIVDMGCYENRRVGLMLFLR